MTIIIGEMARAGVCGLPFWPRSRSVENAGLAELSERCFVDNHGSRRLPGPHCPRSLSVCGQAYLRWKSSLSRARHSQRQPRREVPLDHVAFARPRRRG